MKRATMFPNCWPVKNIVANPAAYLTQHCLKFLITLIFQSVSIDRDMDVALAAKLAEVDLDDFKSLNPAANKPTIFKAARPTFCYLGTMQVFLNATWLFTMVKRQVGPFGLRLVH